MLVAQYFRGAIYIAVHPRFETPLLYKEWLATNFDVCPQSARRYISLTCLLKTFPRLLVTGMSMNALLKYESHIRKAFKGDELLIAHTTVINSAGDRICTISDQDTPSPVGKMHVLVESPLGDSQTESPVVESKV